MTIRQRILITGASAGLGRGMALEFAAKGRDLALCARRLDRLIALRDEIVGRYPHIRVVIRALDVTDYDQVFAVFRAFDEELGGIDRVIVNAGIGRGESVGTGHFAENLVTVNTNFVAALAQCEAALELFRSRDQGHLVTISSVASVRGLPRSQTVYGATKAGLSALTEGVRADTWGSGIRVSAILPGYIDTEILSGSRRRPFIVDADTGCRAIVQAIERERPTAFVPRWPWVPIAFLLRHSPLGLILKFL